MAMKSGQYFTDASIAKVVRVEADRFANADFGWTAPSAGAPYDGYGFMRPRKVQGVCAADAIPAFVGTRRSEIVPDLGANVWTGAATTFTVEDSEGNEHVYTITSRSGELIHLSR